MVENKDKKYNSDKQWELVNFCEFDKYATKSYCAIHNVDESKNLGDITKVDETELDNFNMICGGSPCQDFSVAGKQKGSVWTCKDCVDDNGKHFEYNPLTVHWSKRDCCPNCGSKNIEKTRSSLLVEYLRVVRSNRPNFGIYENVKNIVGKQFKDTTFKLFTDELEEYGYNVYWKVLNAKNYGIPQNRERVYLLFIKKDLDNGKFEFPEPFDNGLRLKDLLEDEVDEKFYISDEKTQKFISSIESKYEKSQNDKFVCEERKDEGLRTYKNDVCGALRTIDSCGDKRVVEIDQPKFIGNVNREDFGTGYAGGVWDDSHISPTLTTMQGGGRQPHVLCGIDKSYNKPELIEYANCIAAREDRGISNRKSEGTAVLKIGNINPSGNGMNGSVYSENGLSPTLTTNKGEGSKVAIKQATKQGYIECEIGGVADLSYPDSKTRRGRVQDNGNTCPTITATETGICRIEPKERFFKQALETLNENDCNSGDTINAFNKHVDKSGYSPTLTTRPEGFKTAILPVTDDIRIRKLTPKECFRLMGFSDENFDAAQKAGVSNSQLYKQAGNSIVVDVLYYIYVELYKAMPYLFDNLKLSSFFSGVGAFEIALDRLYEDINSGNFINPQTE
ncbi:DNA (cytosine-5-)-methyltransferase [Mediterraneibacter gnavus]|uniref:DNA (cytosine-5-)-methyltransferase n=1 Tax=Mediterraneibacter gnavus TaxID=33038 RepID=UPI000E4826D2|nr:DNA (cytosine-5-)-methyltransferase [Mediterraneibacter gnavus]RHE72381.1 DNA (cytosine-5-)-methyltransferase [Mediterraneibacter gnavus]